MRLSIKHWVLSVVLCVTRMLKLLNSYFAYWPLPINMCTLKLLWKHLKARSTLHRTFFFSVEKCVRFCCCCYCSIYIFFFSFEFVFIRCTFFVSSGFWILHQYSAFLWALFLLLLWMCVSEWAEWVCGTLSLFIALLNAEDLCLVRQYYALNAQMRVFFNSKEPIQLPYRMSFECPLFNFVWFLSFSFFHFVFFFTVFFYQFTGVSTAMHCVCCTYDITNYHCALSFRYLIK